VVCAAAAQACDRALSAVPALTATRCAIVLERRPESARRRHDPQTMRSDAPRSRGAAACHSWIGLSQRARMSLLGAIRSTARVTDYVFRHAFPLYAAFYDRYKQLAERDVIACIERSVQPGDRVADVGANIGFYTMLLAERVGRDGGVYAFEPEPYNFTRLQSRTRSYPQVTAVAACVTDHDGTSDLFLSPDLHVDHRTYPTSEVRRSMTVTSVTLDTFFAAGEQLRLLKMDVQGAEFAALRGMQAVVARSPDICLLLELWPSVQDRFGPGTKALLSLLEQWNFHVYRLASGGVAGERIVPETVLPDADDDRNFFDVLCLRPTAPS
jgi:FkbM family methyltransferase